MYWNHDVRINTRCTLVCADVASMTEAAEAVHVFMECVCDGSFRCSPLGRFTVLDALLLTAKSIGNAQSLHAV
jgi:hypothetical protein